jgi:hypothetical protein
VVYAAQISNYDSNKLEKLTGRVIRDIGMSMAYLDSEWNEYLVRDVRMSGEA